MTFADGGTETQRAEAEEMARGNWWQAAKEIAIKYGARDVWAAGRSGGWLYTEPAPENGEYSPAFLAEIETLLNDAPEMFADALEFVRAEDKRISRETLQDANNEARSLIRVIRELPQTSETRATIWALVKKCRARAAVALKELK